MEIKNLENLVATLRNLAAKTKKEADQSVLVGYTQAYALYVHEDLTKAHGEAFNLKHRADIAAGREHSRGKDQQAKFLETPARENRAAYAEIIEQALRQKKTMGQALLLAGLRLQRDSQQVVPVDTGMLKASAFTRLEW